MAIMDAKVCGRKAFLREQVPSNVIKASILRSIAKKVLLSVPFGVSEADLNAAVEAEFAPHAGAMLGFEAESECRRMKVLLWRYIEFERQQRQNTIIADDFNNKVTVMGESRIVSAHRLIDRGTALECIRYLYKAPDISSTGRTAISQANMNPDLLALQRCGEEEARKYGIDKPVFGSFYFMKSKKDRSKQLALGFEESREANIVNHHFTPGEEKNLAEFYKGTKADVNDYADDGKTCNGCAYEDLCHLEFVKRKQEERAPVEETPLDQIHMTKNQQEFVMFEDGQCRVNAVAGSGKTTVVVLRTLRLIEDGCKENEILMVTFTEKAKEEMRTRLRRYAKGATLASANIDADKIVVETFNSFGQTLLEQHYAKLGFSEPPNLVDEVVKKDIIVSLLENHRTLPMDYNNPFLDMPNACGAVIQMGKIIDTLKANHVDTVPAAEAMLSRELKPRASEILDIYQAYNARLVEINCIDYEDQLRLILQLKPFGVFNALPYQHIVVDEFQDSNGNQINLILEMARAATKLRSIVVVGDELQAIYGFRDANPENLVNFGLYFPSMVDIPLEDNFRSQSPIIAMANRILEKEARIAKVIRAHRTEKGLDPVVMRLEDVEDERSLFVRQTDSLLKRGTSPKDIAILCRTKNELLEIQKDLEDAGIPTMLRVPEIIGTAPYVKAIIGLAAFLLDHKNMLDFALYRKSLGHDPFDTVALQKDAEELGKKYDELKTEAERILLFTGLIADAKEDYIAAAFVEEIMGKGFHTARDIFKFCVKYRNYKIKETKSTAREDVDAVTLITVHSGKGLEWPVVLLSIRKFKPANDEEHRLLYVAVTRAKEKLLITYTQKQETLVSLLN